MPRTTTAHILGQLRTKAEALREAGWSIEVFHGDRQVLLKASHGLNTRWVHVRQLSNCWVWRSQSRGCIRVQTIY